MSLTPSITGLGLDQLGGRETGGHNRTWSKKSPLRDLWWIIADSAKNIEHKTSLLN